MILKNKRIKNTLGLKKRDKDKLLQGISNKLL
jgi:hypothetical protein